MPRARRQAASRYFSSAQVARILGIHKTTLHHWIRTGKIDRPEADPANGYYRWSAYDVDGLRRTLEKEVP